ncbi:MAG: hypothetical protein ACHQE5_01690 [Actinomycetes bacterium]
MTAPRSTRSTGLPASSASPGWSGWSRATGAGSAASRYRTRPDQPDQLDEADEAGEAGGPVLRVERGAVTERHVREAGRTGARIVAARGVVLTPLARDRARSSGIDIEKEY